MTGFTKALAAEVASRGITANIVAPGFIRTPMTDALTDDQKSNLLGNVPAGRPVKQLKSPPRWHFWPVMRQAT